SFFLKWIPFKEIESGGVSRPLDDTGQDRSLGINYDESGYYASRRPPDIRRSPINYRTDTEEWIKRDSNVNYWGEVTALEWKKHYN
ncbi:MAG: hypothetical protein P8Y38_08555, partial [Deltaproteobacteria bacterium]